MKPLVLPDDVEEFRDHQWRRDETRRVETAAAAERFIEDVGFAFCLTDARRPGPSLYVAVCGRRDAVMPRNVQTDPEASATWQLKDERVKRGRVGTSPPSAWTDGLPRSAPTPAGAIPECSATTSRGA